MVVFVSRSMFRHAFPQLPVDRIRITLFDVLPHVLSMFDSKLVEHTEVPSYQYRHCCHYCLLKATTGYYCYY